MRNLKRFGVVVIAAIVLATLPASAGDMTVGQFVQQLARAKNLSATDARIAADSLAGVGIVLPRSMSFDKALTEGDVTQIARIAGLNVRTANPNATFDSVKADRFFDAFAGELRTTQKSLSAKRQTQKSHNNGNGRDEHDPGDGPPFGKGKGKGKGDMTPTDPD